jgi:hypothetical protein
MKLELSIQIFENKPQISSFIEIRLVGAELFHVDGRTDMNIIVALRNFAKTHNKHYVCEI